MHHIVCLSTTAFHAFPTRKQQVMSRIPDAQILYFDPPVTYLAPLRSKAARSQLRAYREPGEQVQPNVWRYALPPILPFYNKKRAVNRMNRKRLARCVKQAMAEHGFGPETVLWVYHPSYVDAALEIPHASLIYDCVDRHSAYPGLIDPNVVDGMEQELAKACDMVFATSTGLYETLSGFNPHAAMIPNGANYELFSQVLDPAMKPDPRVKDLPKPVFGFVGALQECTDLALIGRIAVLYPQGSVVFVGNPLPGVDVSALQAMDNVHFLGKVPQKELPGLICGFDVCLNLFVNNDLSRDVSPLKFYEYLATGKPILISPEPSQVLAFQDAVYLTREDNLAEACQAALSEPDDRLTRRRAEYGKSCSWDARVAQIREALAERGILTEK